MLKTGEEKSWHFCSYVSPGLIGMTPQSLYCLANAGEAALLAQHQHGGKQGWGGFFAGYHEANGHEQIACAYLMFVAKVA